MGELSAGATCSRCNTGRWGRGADTGGGGGKGGEENRGLGVRQERCSAWDVICGRRIGELPLLIAQACLPLFLSSLPSPPSSNPLPPLSSLVQSPPSPLLPRPISSPPSPIFPIPRNPSLPFSPPPPLPISSSSYPLLSPRFPPPLAPCFSHASPLFPPF
ncbi:unnamed protein product [Closterium sp. NIES-64]|nr:unnamed protein product [Closterium sp. NIES-64]